MSTPDYPTRCMDRDARILDRLAEIKGTDKVLCVRWLGNRVVSGDETWQEIMREIATDQGHEEEEA